MHFYIDASSIPRNEKLASLFLAYPKRLAYIVRVI